MRGSKSWSGAKSFESTSMDERSQQGRERQIERVEPKSKRVLESLSDVN
jgi:hypothetical protein